MNKLGIFAVLLLAACEVNTPTALTDQLEAVGVAHEVHFVSCPDSLNLAIREQGFCEARNIDSTLVEWTDLSPTVWLSSLPAVVSVNLGGRVEARGAVGGWVWITGSGTNRSFATDSILAWSP